MSPMGNKLAEPETQPQLDDKAIVENYFNTVGFDRWQRIYGDGEVNRVQQDIRVGHQQTVDTVLEWLRADGDLAGRTCCDAGCGVGSLSIPLAALGATVFASDLSEKMVAEAEVRARECLKNKILHTEGNPGFKVQDLESISGSYHTVICLDVLIHYPEDKAGEMIGHLSSLATNCLIVSFAPKTPCYTLLKRIGDFFPGPSKATRAYLHREAQIRQILELAGWQINRTAMSKTRFYFSRILEATRTSPT